MNLNSAIQQNELTGDFQIKVFGLVAYAMGVSAIATFFSAQIFATAPILSSGWVTLIALLGLVFTQGFWAQREPLNLILFSLIAFLLGLSIAPLISLAIAIDPALLTKAFVATAALSFAAGIFGATTKKDLSGIGGFLIIALIGLIVVGLLNIIWPSDTVGLLVSGAGVILFSIFISYEIQMLRRYPKEMAITAAIGLYLSIFNLFQSVLSLLIQMQLDD